MVYNTRKHHHTLGDPTGFESWAPKVDAIYRVFGATTTRRTTTKAGHNEGTFTDFEVFRDNPDDPHHKLDAPEPIRRTWNLDHCNRGAARQHYHGV
eukprot:8744179-Heterocapsa_arctica.AAC.1